MNLPLTVLEKKGGGDGALIGVLVREGCLAVDAFESRRPSLDDAGTTIDVDIPGSRGDLALGVVALVDWSSWSDSSPASRGVIGRCMPGIYPGNLGVGEVVRELEYIPGAGEVVDVLLNSST